MTCEPVTLLVISYYATELPPTPTPFPTLCSTSPHLNMSVTSCSCQTPHIHVGHLMPDTPSMSVPSCLCHVTFMPENHVFMSVTLYLSLTVSYLISMDGHLISLVSHGLVSMVSRFLSSCPYKSPYIHDLLLHVLMSMVSHFVSMLPPHVHD